MFNSFGDIQNRYRIEKNISIGKLAELTGICRSSLAKIESGETKRPSFNTCKKVANTLDIPYSITINSCLNHTERPESLKFLLQEAISTKSPTLVQKCANRLLETPRLDTFLALDYLFQIVNVVEDDQTKFPIYDTIIDYTRKQGVPHYLAKGIFERYMFERDDFTRFKETYHRGKELLHYIESLLPSERISFYYRMGAHADILGYPVDCIELCRKGIHEDQTDSIFRASALLALFNSYVLLGDLILANYFFEEYANSQYADYRKKHCLAVLSAKKGEFDKSIQLYKELLEEAEQIRRISIVSDLLDVYLEIDRDDLIKQLIETEEMFISIDNHPNRIKSTATYYQRKGACLLRMGQDEEGLNSLIESIHYYRRLGVKDKMGECICLFLNYHRTKKQHLSFEHMEIIENLWYNC
ncbi:XRE family transcriptional regulator [Brevibacillus brevis X23]|nr:XRE family transcriptional regulator [Brevibacillus brevis X23]